MRKEWQNLEFDAPSKGFHHVSVLLQPVLQELCIQPDGIYVDGTLGGAGHATAIAAMLSPQGRLIGIDQDAAALVAGEKRLAGVRCQVSLVRGNFSRMGDILATLNISQVDGILLDLGVSSHQLDTVERGFSYMQDAPLDMRMDNRQTGSALEVVNDYSEQELARIIKEYGEERWAKRIASFICQRRQQQRLQTTGELVEVIKQAIPASARREGPHPAKRTFQAIRIEVNQELEVLKQVLEQAVRCLKPGGRLAVITFHSLEDRIVKQNFQRLSQTCVCPPGQPICTCHTVPLLKRPRKAIVPIAEELEENPRARSAKLRIGERLNTPV